MYVGLSGILYGCILAFNTFTAKKTFFWHYLFQNTYERYNIVFAYIKNVFIGVMNEHFKTYVYQRCLKTHSTDLH